MWVTGRNVCLSCSSSSATIQDWLLVLPLIGWHFLPLLKVRVEVFFQTLTFERRRLWIGTQPETSLEAPFASDWGILQWSLESLKMWLERHSRTSHYLQRKTHVILSQSERSWGSSLDEANQSKLRHSPLDFFVLIPHVATRKKSACHHADNPVFSSYNASMNNHSVILLSLGQLFEDKLLHLFTMIVISGVKFSSFPSVCWLSVVWHAALVVDLWLFCPFLHDHCVFLLSFPHLASCMLPSYSLEQKQLPVPRYKKVRHHK